MDKRKVFIFIFLFVDFVILLYLLAYGKNIALMNPAGIVSYGERHVILALTSLMLVVAIPTVIILFTTAFKYREGNHKAKYDPEGKGNLLTHALWWTIPSILVVLMAIVSWRATHALDPYKPIASNVKPLTVQVVALDWKWLFIYPEQNIATVNFLELPVNTPVSFVLTADAPMNSFWIPQLSGQIYAMSGMSTQIHMMGTKIGEYAGGAAEINGKGFSEMRFVTKVVSQKDFDGWVTSVKNTSKPLSKTVYQNLAKPSENTPKQFYSPVDDNLYNSIVTKFIVPTGADKMMMNMPGMMH